MVRKSVFTVVSAVALAAMSCAAAHADTVVNCSRPSADYDFTTCGAKESPFILAEQDCNVAYKFGAKADFHLSDNLLSVTLTNISPSIHSDQELLSGLSFDIEGTNGGSILNQSDGERYKSKLQKTQKGEHGTSEWSITSSKGSAGDANDNYVLSAFSGNGGDQQNGGNGDGQGWNLATIKDFNGSNLCSGSQYISTTATFDYSICGLTAADHVTDVNFGYGSHGDWTKGCSSGSSPSVPEPATLSLLAIPAAAALLRRRSGRKGTTTT